MLNLPSGIRIYIAAGWTDMRRGFNGLQGQVAGVLGEDPFSGHLFLFVNRRCDKLIRNLFYAGFSRRAIFAPPDNADLALPSAHKFSDTDVP